VAGYEPLSIDLRLLQSFVILAEELHFTRAAERLHIAQPALSQQIGRLERQLGAKLLTRPPLPVTLTPAGTELHARAGAALADIKAAVSAVRAVADGAAGALRIAHLSSYAPHVIPAIAGAFTAANPEITLHLSEGSIEEQIDGIRAHDVDVAMFHLDPDNKRIETGVEQHVIASAPQFVGDISIDPNYLRPRLTVRAGLSSLTVDEQHLTMRSMLHRERLPWSQVTSFEPHFPDGNTGPTAKGVLVALTPAGAIELPATRRQGGELRHVHALLDAYRVRAQQFANG